ncbi:hypothetical protein HRbin35_00360 [bacterium HR35]|nr:hypothetical protein HRbin35_00360 [bacterium HR35]
MSIDDFYFLNERIKEYEEIISEECKKRNTFLFSVIEEWLKIDYLDLLSEDGIHPNEKGHQKIFEKIKPLFI